MRMFSHLALILTCLGPSLSQAALPEISSAELVDAVLYGDQQIQNLKVDYVIDETFMDGFSSSLSMPDRRILAISFTQENNKYFYDVAITSFEDGTDESDEWFYQDAFNGQTRTQFNPESTFGDVFANPFSHAFPIPHDFGLSLGVRTKLLGEDLSQSEIHSIETVTLDGHECYYVQATQSQGKRVEVWIDPAVGFRARSLKLYNTDGGRNYESQADFSQNEEGIWFPSSGTAQLYGRNLEGERAVAYWRNFTMENIEINTSPTTQDFAIDFPLGSKVYDHIVGIGYTVGATSIEGVLENQLEASTVAVKNNEYRQSPPDTDVEIASKPQTTASAIAQNIEFVTSVDLTDKRDIRGLGCVALGIIVIISFVTSRVRRRS